jgi:hypothetical protein
MPVQGMAACQLNSKFTIVLSNRERVVQVKMCKPTAKITELCNLVVPRTDHSIVHAANNKILVIGGQCVRTHALLDSIEVYDIILKIW